MGLLVNRYKSGSIKKFGVKKVDFQDFSKV